MYLSVYGLGNTLNSQRNNVESESVTMWQCINTWECLEETCPSSHLDNSVRQCATPFEGEACMVLLTFVS